MAQISLTIDLGARVAPEVLAAITGDVATLSIASREWGAREAERAAGNEVADLLRRSPRTLRERASRLERAGVEGDIEDLIAWAESNYEWRELFRDPRFRRVLRGWHEEFPFVSPWTLAQAGWAAGSPPPIIAALAADSAYERLGDGPQIISVSYENPLELVLVATGGVLLALRQLLIVVRDWPARRRIGNAAANEAEAAATIRTELRRELLDRYRRGDISASPQEIDELLGTSPIEAMARLAALETKVEELPDVGQ